MDFNFDQSKVDMYSNAPVSSGNGNFKPSTPSIVSDEMVKANTEELERINGIEQQKINLKRQIQEIDDKIISLQNSISGIESKYAPKAMTDEELETKLSANRARRIKKDNTAQYQWNWEKNREDAERRYQEGLKNSNDSQTRMKVNGAANDIRNKQIAISNDFRQMTSTIDPFQRKSYEDKILTDLDQLQMSYDTLLKTYTPEQLAGFGLSDMKSYVDKVKTAIKEGKFSADADYAKVKEIESQYDGYVRSKTLTEDVKNNLLSALEPYIQKNSKEAFDLRQKIVGGTTGEEELSSAQQANKVSRTIQHGNEAADANKLTVDQLFKKLESGVLTDVEQKALEKKYPSTQSQADAQKYKDMNATQKDVWQERNPGKFNYLRSKGLI